ncbi:hypothetical protein IID24_05065 [Patescibacteria group bacterium]|nr:hypothetical protein [Patescibacteria group bacterium]
MSFPYAYLVGSLVFFLIWLAVFIVRRDLRKEILWASFLAMPFGLSEIFFVPEYWNPPSLFNLIDKIGFGIESLLYTFSIGGLAAVSFEFVRGRKLQKIVADRKLHIVPYIINILIYLGLELVFPEQSIYNASVSLLIGAGIIGYLRRDLIRQIIFSGFFFSFAYFVLFSIFNVLFPDFVKDVYSLDNFIGFSIIGVPIEEIIFAFSIGAFWSTLYEFMRGYRTKRVH